MTKLVKGDLTSSEVIHSYPSTDPLCLNQHLSQTFRYGNDCKPTHKCDRPFQLRFWCLSIHVLHIPMLLMVEEGNGIETKKRPIATLNRHDCRLLLLFLL